jgi:hypothetical protein
LDYFLYGALIVTLAAFFTLHVWLSVALLAEKPRWRGLVAFFVPPLAPVYGVRAGKKKRAIAWVVLLVLYVLARIAAAFAPS